MIVVNTPFQITLFLSYIAPPKSLYVQHNQTAATPLSNMRSPSGRTSLRNSLFNSSEVTEQLIPCTAIITQLHFRKLENL